MSDDKELEERLGGLFSDKNPAESSPEQSEEKLDVSSSVITKKDAAATEAFDRDTLAGRPQPASTSNQSTQAERDRVARILLSILLGAAVAVIVAMLFLGSQSDTWQYYGMAGAAAFLGLAVGVALQLVKGGKHRGAATVTIGSLSVALLTVASLTSGLGILLLLVTLLLGLLFSIQMLSGAEIVWGAVGSLAGGALVLLADSVLTQFEIDVSGIANVVAIVVALLAVSIVVFLLVEFRNYAIPSKLTVTYVLVAVIPLGTLTYFFTQSTQQALTEEADHSLQAAAIQTAEALDTFIQSGLDIVRVQTQNPTLKDYLLLSPSERPLAEEGLVQQEVSEILRSFVDYDTDHISSYALLDKAGVNIADTFGEGLGVDESDQDYFRVAVQSELPHISPVQFSSDTTEGSIYFSAPVFDAGEIIGVLRVQYEATHLQEIIEAQTGRLGEDSFAILFDENHLRLSDGEDPDLNFTTLVALDPTRLIELQAAGRIPRGSAEDVSTDLAEFEGSLSNFADTPIFVGDPHGDGVPDRAAIVQLQTQPWFVTFLQGESILLAPVKAETQTATVASLVLTGLATLLAVFITRQLSRPIVDLTHTAQQVARGDLSAVAAIESNDEIGELAITFNSMTIQLKDILEGLEQRVADRTRALTTSTEVGRRLSTILSQVDLVSEVVNQVRSAFNYYHVHIYLLSEDGRELIMAGGTGEAGRSMLAQSHRISWGKGLVGRAAKSNSVVLVPDVSQEPGWLSNPLLLDTRSEAAVPISAAGRVLGVLDVQHDVVNGLEQSDAELLQSIANQVAVALHNARLYESSERKAESEALVNKIGQRIQNTTTLDDLLKIAARELGQALGAQRTSLQLSGSPHPTNDVTTSLS